ncbi:Carboxylesterase, type B [Cordyceps fumosorosea ARSEF 2679]|uniref:Carboxylic ester hydrolase n=1 Tax=Cordyceps fumosorosea (strain ARSEF 2679) TaxID=1081104 RepID=A0A168ENH0_CORFA|nr:Carboxylesterase, type B [Cordyceps fumosorosea ARSEF 2679]OAA74026.1 Carboxylesterase, type B [Cordyceps fumosorosea ARSEF 2679]
MAKFIYTSTALLWYQAALSSALALTCDDCPTATIDSGILIGTAASEPTVAVPVNKFLGIPFAKPPTRWKLPEKPDSWQGSRDASRFGNACYQQLLSGAKNAELLKEYFNTPPATVPDSEDCLYLNVFAPASVQPGSNKAVMFWIHGGTDQGGTAALPEYDGTNLAGNQDVIVVTTNYRLNLFGFPSSPDIPAKERNLGLHDQRLALDWVQRNIEAFGGDPDLVTIFGQSSGARSVDTLITAPPDPVPFAAAIMESSEPELSMPDRDLEKATWNSLVSNAGCNSTANALDCMRQVPAAQLIAIAEKNGLSFTASPDGGVTFVNSIPAKRAASLVHRKAIARVPLLIGSNADEASPFLTGGVTLDEIMAAFLGNSTAELFLKKYRPTYTGYPTPEKRDEALVTDFVYTCPTARTAGDSTAVKIPTWRYFYNASFANTELFPGSGAYHSAEIRPVFGFYPRSSATAFEIESSRVIQKAWADFAKDPAGGPGWGQAPEVQLLGGGASPGLSDDNRLASAPINASITDAHCSQYKSLYDTIQVTGIIGNTLNAILRLL